jgi:hypothetical protein
VSPGQESILSTEKADPNLDLHALGFAGVVPETTGRPGGAAEETRTKPYSKALPVGYIVTLSIGIQKFHILSLDGFSNLDLKRKQSLFTTD